MTQLAPSAFEASAAASRGSVLGAASRGAALGVFFSYYYYGTARAVSD